MQSATLMFKTEHDIVMHIAVLVRIAMADGKFHDSEKAFITNTAVLYAKAYGTRPFEVMVDECIEGLPKTAVDDWLSALSTHPSEARNLIKCSWGENGKMDCPKCGSSNVKATNLAARAASTTCAFVVGAVVSLITRSAAGGDVYKNLRKNMCERETWRCCNCGHTYSCGRSI